MSPVPVMKVVEIIRAISADRRWPLRFGFGRATCGVPSLPALVA